MSDVYYPSIAVNLALRFDEAFLLAQSPMPDPVVNGSTDDDTLPYLIDDTASLASPLPTSHSPGKDGLAFLVGRIPISGSIELNTFRQASKFSLTFKWSDFPIDPRLLRAAGVEIYMGAVKADDFADGVSASSNKTNQLRSSYVKQTPDNLMFVGAADEISYELSEKTNSVTFQGRDSRCILLDSPIPPKLFSGKNKLNLDQPISDVVKDIIKKHPHGEKINCIAFSGDWIDLDGNKTSEPHPAAKGNVTAVNLSPAGEGATHSTASGSKGTTFWHLIETYCELVAAVPYFVGANLHIRPAVAIYSHLKKTGEDAGTKAPFKDGKPRTILTNSGTIQQTVRMLVYGRNINRVTATRKFGGYKTKAVEVTSYNVSSKVRGGEKLLKVTWPKQSPKLKAGKGSAGGKKASLASITDVDISGKPSSDTIRISRPGITDEKVLLKIAEALYNEIGRHDIGGTAETKNLASFGGDNDDPDMLHLRPGDPVRVITDLRDKASPAIPASTFMENQRDMANDWGKAVRDIAAKLGGAAPTVGDMQLARAIVASTNKFKEGVNDYYITNNVKYDWSEGKVKIVFDYSNYIEIRQDVSATATVDKKYKGKSAPKQQTATASTNSGGGSQATANSNGTFSVNQTFSSGGTP